MQERQINSIVKDVYMHFIDVKSLFIFNNAEEYTVIEKFLPTSLDPYAERPYILITSRNRNWDVGDEGQIDVMQLDVFTQKEATMFIKDSIEIKDGLQKGDIEKLTKRLQYLPLALRQAIAYINQEDKTFKKRGSGRFKISDYLKKLDENTELLNKGYYKVGNRYSQTVLTTWTTTLEKIKEDQDHGTKAINILNVMAYLAPDKIYASKMFDCDGVELCDKYSMIEYSEGVASIHRLVQEAIRLKLKDESGEEAVIEEALTLIGNNENISKEDTSHVTSVWSYASGYSELIQKFYFDSNSIPTYGYNNATPLHLLAENGSDEAVKAILDKAILMKEQFPEKFSKIDAKDKYNRTPLYMAVENGHASVVKLFVDKGAKIDIKSTIVYNSLSTKKASDWTLLHVAAFNGYSDIVEILVNKDNTLVDIKDSIGRTAAVLAASSGQINVLKILEPYDSGPYNVYLLHAEFRAARKSDNLEDLKNFLKDLEEKHQLRDIINVKLGEWTPLHVAAFANWLDIIKILITYGAEVKDRTPSFTPLHSASSNGHLDVIKYLIGKGAHPKDINEDGWTSLHAAAQNGHLHVVKYFIDEHREIDVDIIDNACATPLHTAAFHGKLNVVEFLLSKGANINAVNILGATPLFIAAINNNRDVYDFLLNKDATVVNTSDDQTLIGRLNISVLHVAAVYNDKQMIEDLINKGVDKDIGKDTSLTPLYFATFFDSLEATEYLIASGAATDVSINTPIIRKILEETVNDSTLKPSSMPKFVSTLINFVNILPPNDIELSANDLKCTIETLCSFVPNFGQLIDSLKIYVEQRKNPDLDLPLHAVFFTQEVGINSNDGDE
ncbi:CARD- and ANK-domain containing inflammasome adapter protein-like [Bombus flavifrons]|uniref:CARD- and ANK-domain containing inflammasome adapter protein-like n=1 Tax=Bombus flavifrons TaxID=103934 RepID=UPI003703DD5F